MRPVVVAAHYFRTFFFIDLGVVTANAMNIVFMMMEKEISTSAENMRYLRIAKLGRMLRIFGIVRVIHLMEVFNRLQTKPGHMSMGVAEITVILFAILWLNHTYACCFYALGTLAPSDTGARWIHELVSGGQSADMITYSDTDFWYQYTSSYHWALSQMTPGSIQVNPLNTYERLFTISCLVFGIFCTSFLVSLLSAKLTSYKIQMQSQNKTVSTLRRFLRRANISPHLAVSVQQQVKTRMNCTKLLTFNDVRALDLLTLSLRAKLRAEMCMPHIRVHSLFRFWAQADLDGMQKLCDIVGFIALAPLDNLFLPGSEASEAYVLTEGGMVYTQSPASSYVVVDCESVVLQDMWICEMALWVKWTHVGAVEATNMCELLILRAELFAKAVAQRPYMRHVVWEYARGYHGRLRAASPPAASWPSDLEVPFTDFVDIVIGMKSNVQIFIGLHALEVARAASEANAYQLTRKRPDFEQLYDEVCNSTCVLVTTGQDEVQRAVVLEALQLTHLDGRLWVELGTMRDGADLRITGRLPGSKIGSGDLPGDALKRILNGWMKPFREAVKVENVERTVEVKDSSRYGVNTRYTRTIYNAILDETLALPIKSIGKFSQNTCPRSSIGSTVSYGTDSATSTVNEVTHNIAKISHATGSQSWVSADSKGVNIPCDDVYEFYEGEESPSVVYGCWIDPDDLNLFSNDNVVKACRSWLEEHINKEDIQAFFDSLRVDQDLESDDEGKLPVSLGGDSEEAHSC